MIAFLAILAALSAVSANHISPCPLKYADAVAYCASQGSTLASVTGANLAALTAQAGNTPKWVGSWNGDKYPGACLVLSQGTVVVADCGAQNQAMCNVVPAPNPCPGPSPTPCPPIPVCESSSSDSQLPNPQPLPIDCSSSSSSLDCLPSSSSVYGPSSRSRSSRRSSSSSGWCGSSSSSSCSDAAFQYVYLTNTVSSLYVSRSTSVTTATGISTFYFGTVQAYTVTGPG